MASDTPEAGEQPATLQRHFGLLHATALNISMIVGAGVFITIPLMLCLHELATNALKYGALSVPGGRILVTWVLDEQNRAVLTWIEEGGPQVAPPTRKGMGTGLLRGQNGLADVEVIYASAGVRCVIIIEGAELG